MKLETIALHAGHTPDQDTLSRAVPIYQTSSYVFKDTNHAADLFALRDLGNIYTRLMNPTTGVLEARLAALNNGKGAVATSSGMSAIFYSITNICSAGQNFIANTKLYGGTYTLFTAQLNRFGIEVRFVDMSKPEEIEKAIDENTRLVFTESIGNPDCNIDDLQAIADIAHKNELPLMVDSTVSPPPILNVFDYGVDICIYSLTKIIGGHGTSIGGCIVERGEFNWNNGKFPEMVEPDPAYHGASYWNAFGNHADALIPGISFVIKIRTGLLRDVGACLSPFNAQQILLGLETLPLRAERHCENALKVAKFLEKNELVEWVNYAGLESHKDYDKATKDFKIGPGAVFGFGVKGGAEAGAKFINSVKLCSHLANILDAKTLVIHPASTTHQQLTEQQQIDAGVKPEMIRISVGIENIDDILEDIQQALTATKGE